MRALRRSGQLTCVLALLAASLLTPVAAAAAPAEPLSAAGQPGDFHATVTLLTGDTVEYTESADGRVSATTPGRNSGLRVYSDPTGYYVVPSEAEPYLASGVLDHELFDVKYLAHNGYGDDRMAELPVIVGYGQTVAGRSAAPATRLPGATKRRDLSSVNAGSLTIAPPLRADS